MPGKIVTSPRAKLPQDLRLRYDVAQSNFEGPWESGPGRIPSAGDVRRMETGESKSPSPGWLASEDVWAVLIAGAIMAVAFALVWGAQPEDRTAALMEIRAAEQALDEAYALPENAASREQAIVDASAKVHGLKKRWAPNPVAGWIGKPGKWSQSPVESLLDAAGTHRWVACLITGIVAAVLFGVAMAMRGSSVTQFLRGFLGIFGMAMASFVVASQSVISDLNLAYPLWALILGLVIANTVGTPAWMKPAVQTEFYIKTGLVLLGAKIWLGQLLALGVPGIFVSWIVTPIVLVSTYWFGQRVLRMSSRSLNMTISADMSVCGVSAAIATAAACRAKKEELSIAISLSLMFTVGMMFVMPLLIRAVGMSEVLGGAWMGGTIDATGAVAAAGKFLGPKAETIAVTVKMIQNILIGVVAFFVALYWVTFVEPQENQQRPSAWVIWERFPKFVIGFLGASFVFSALAAALPAGDLLVTSMVKSMTDVFRGWFFCLAFVSIGLDTHFRKLAEHFRGGRPLILYVVGQSLNLLLTLGMAWLMFEVIFRDAAANL